MIGVKSILWQPSLVVPVAAILWWHPLSVHRIPKLSTGWAKFGSSVISYLTVKNYPAQLTAAMVINIDAFLTTTSLQVQTEALVAIGNHLQLVEPCEGRGPHCTQVTSLIFRLTFLAATAKLIFSHLNLVLKSWNKSLKSPLPTQCFALWLALC